MSRGWKFLVACACVLAALAIGPAASAASPQQIYRDYAQNGRLDRQYSTADLQRALGFVALQGYPRVGFKGAVEAALGAQASRSSGGLPFTGLDLALLSAGGMLLAATGALLVKIGRPPRR